MRRHADGDDVVHLGTHSLRDGFIGAGDTDAAHWITLEDKGTQPQPYGIIATLLARTPVSFLLPCVGLAVLLAASTSANINEYGAACGGTGVLRMRHVYVGRKPGPRLLRITVQRVTSPVIGTARRSGIVAMRPPAAMGSSNGAARIRCRLCRTVAWWRSLSLRKRRCPCSIVARP